MAFKFNPFTGTLDLVNSSAGDVVGPASSTDNAIVRYDGTTGKLIQNSAVIISDTGTIGVGTSSPSATVHIVGGASSTQLRLSDVETDATTKNLRLVGTAYTTANLPATVFNMQNTSANNFLTIGGGTSLNNAATIIAFNTAANNNTTTGTERVRIDSSGNVGISTTAPSVLLHVGAGLSTTIPNGVGTLTSTQVLNSQTSGFAGFTAYVNDGTFNRRIGLFVDNTNSIQGISSTYSSTAIPFVYRDAVGERFRVSTAGFFGIGTSSPNANLEVADSAAILRLTGLNTSVGSGATYADIEFYTNDSSGVGVMGKIRSRTPLGSFGNSGELGFYTYNSSSGLVQRAYIGFDGTFGINTSLASKQLEVNSSTGDCLRLTYNDSDGSATNYTDLTVSSSGDLTITPSGGDVNIVGRIAKRVVTAADATSITPNSNSADITYQANTQAIGTLTINADSGSPINGQAWLLKIKSTNIQTFSWNALYVGGTTALPTATTGSSQIDYYAFIYDTVDTKWHYTGGATNF